MAIQTFAIPAFLGNIATLGGHVITCLIFVVVAFIMISIGISNVRSTAPVGFYTGIEPPSPDEITDIPAYNKKHGWLWIGYGIGFIACALIPLLTDSELLFTLVTCVLGVGGVLLIMVGHLLLDKRYRRQNKR